jgi:hypothetical protein
MVKPVCAYISRSNLAFLFREIFEEIEGTLGGLRDHISGAQVNEAHRLWGSLLPSLYIYIWRRTSIRPTPLIN